VACADDGLLRTLLPRMTRRVITYGLDDPLAGLGARSPRLEAFGSRSEVVRQDPSGQHVEVLGPLHLRVPGRHNLANALAAVAVGLELGIAYERIAAALAEFHGADRRFQLLGEVDGVMVVDDYGHHPAEIAAVIDAARAGLHRRLLVVFQPHRYTRTAQLVQEFGEVLARADELLLTEVYGAGEAPIPGATADAIAAAVRRAGDIPVNLVGSVDQVAGAVVALARPGDMVITLGAGSIGTAGPLILQALQARRSTQTDT
jgi:UDP-N-acetylmuramate--alanine ligase